MKVRGLIKRKGTGIALVRRCRVCGCTESMACVTAVGPCHWVEANLCSACVKPPQKSAVLAVVGLVLLLLAICGKAKAKACTTNQVVLRFAVTNGMMGLGYEAAPRARYCIEQSTDLRNWTVLDCRDVTAAGPVWVVTKFRFGAWFFRLRVEQGFPTPKKSVDLTGGARDPVRTSTPPVGALNAPPVLRIAKGDL